MSRKTFKQGGIHPPEMKQLSENTAIERIEAPARVVLPLSQHIGGPAKAVVKPGDHVLKGQIIAEATGFVSVPVHSSVSGAVKEIFTRATPLGRQCEHIAIENDGKDEAVSGLGQERDWQNMKREELVKAVQDAGLVGMGGAAFPTHVKLSPPPEAHIDTLVINGVECEPFLTIDGRMMLEYPREVVEGVRILQRTLGVNRVIIGIEANKKEAFAAIRAAAREHDDIAVEMLTVKYPQGAEKQLIDALLHRQVPPGKLPLDIGVVVQNVTTAYMVYQAVANSTPLIERPLTVTGDGIERPANLIVPIGISIGEIIARQGLREETRKIIMGGPMMGVAVFDPELSVVKGTSGLLALIEGVSTISHPCIRCGRCVEVCPLATYAPDIVAAVKEGRVEDYEKLHVMDCVECGSCAFQCPARRPLIHYVKLAKAELAAWRAKHRK